MLHTMFGLTVTSREYSVATMEFEVLQGSRTDSLLSDQTDPVAVLSGSCVQQKTRCNRKQIGCPTKYFVLYVEHS